MRRMAGSACISPRECSPAWLKESTTEPADLTKSTLHSIGFLMCMAVPPKFVLAGTPTPYSSALRPACRLSCGHPDSHGSGHHGVDFLDRAAFGLDAEEQEGECRQSGPKRQKQHRWHDGLDPRLRL